MAPETLTYSREQLLNIQSQQQCSDIFDWRHIDSILGRPTSEQQTQGIKAIISNRLSGKNQYNQQKTDCKRNTLISLPTYCSMMRHDGNYTNNHNQLPSPDVGSSGVNGEAGVLCNAVPWSTPHPGYGRGTSAQCTFKPPVSRYVVPLIKASTKSEKCDTQPNIFLANCQSLNAKKTDELRIISAEHQADIIMATETWFKTTKNIQLPNYKLYSTQRINRMGGGTAIYTSTSLATQQLHNFTFNNDIMSAVWVKSSAGGTTCPPVIYGCIYHPPRADEETTLNYLVKTLTEILVKYPNHSLVLGGDFNSLDCSALENVFHLTNIVKFPIRENSFLDKIYTNDMSYINANVQKCAPLGKADHACVLVHDVILKKSEYRTVYKRTGHIYVTSLIWT